MKAELINNHFKKPLNKVFDCEVEAYQELDQCDHRQVGRTQVTFAVSSPKYGLGVTGNAFCSM